LPPRRPSEVRYTPRATQSYRPYPPEERLGSRKARVQASQNERGLLLPASQRGTVCLRWRIAAFAWPPPPPRRLGGTPRSPRFVWSALWWVEAHAHPPPGNAQGQARTRSRKKWGKRECGQRRASVMVFPPIETPHHVPRRDKGTRQKRPSSTTLRERVQPKAGPFLSHERRTGTP